MKEDGKDRHLRELNTFSTQPLHATAGTLPTTGGNNRNPPLYRLPFYY
jgi:hypothetical protein